MYTYMYIYIQDIDLYNSLSKFSLLYESFQVQISK